LIHKRALNQVVAAYAGFRGDGQTEIVQNFAGVFQHGRAAAEHGAVVLRFPDMASARAWYDSPEYAAVKDQRIAATEGRAILVESLLVFYLIRLILSIYMFGRGCYRI